MALMAGRTRLTHQKQDSINDSWASHEYEDEVDTKKVPAGLLTKRSKEVMEKGTDCALRFETIANAYNSHGLMATFVFGFSIAIFNSGLSLPGFLSRNAHWSI